MSGRGAAGDSEKPPVHEASSLDAEAASNRRVVTRVDVTWAVDCETEDTFLYASITNISELGIFVRTTDPLPVGTLVRLRFALPRQAEAHDALTIEGTVQWVNALRPLSDNPNPGMGIRFVGLTLDDRERIVEAVRTIAYLRESPTN